jgi:hypothetical protein
VYTYILVGLRNGKAAKAQQRAAEPLTDKYDRINTNILCASNASYKMDSGQQTVQQKLVSPVQLNMDLNY